MHFEFVIIKPADTHFTQSEMASQCGGHCVGLRVDRTGFDRSIKHQFQTGHLMDLSNPEILYKESIRGKRLFLEAYATKNDSINRCIEINPVYRGIR